MAHRVGGVDFLVDIVTVLGLVGGVPRGETPRVADSSASISARTSGHVPWLTDD